jgi:magnesium transporter
LCSPHERAVFNDHGRYIHVTTYAPREDEEGELHGVECVVGQNWVITAHDRPIPVLEEFADRVSGSGDTGSLDGTGFLAALLEWVLGSYCAAFERIEQRLEKFDVNAMRGHGEDKDIELLIDMRQQVGKLRRALAAHREALVALTHPELEALGDNASGERFESLFSRYEATLQEARDAKEAIVGSFEVLIARGGHQTNRIMTVLTLTPVILLPGPLLAGVMGMNFRLGLFDNASLFWVVVAIIVAIAPVTLGLARSRRWI